MADDERQSAIAAHPVDRADLAEHGLAADRAGDMLVTRRRLLGVGWTIAVRTRRQSDKKQTWQQLATKTHQFLLS